MNERRRKLPASNIGTNSCSFLTLNICSLIALISLNDCLLARLNTIINPWPFLMYKSLLRCFNK